MRLGPPWCWGHECIGVHDSGRNVRTVKIAIAMMFEGMVREGGKHVPSDASMSR
jgi:hypothetical protein